MVATLKFVGSNPTSGSKTILMKLIYMKITLAYLSQSKRGRKVLDESIGRVEEKGSYIILHEK